MLGKLTKNFSGALLQEIVKASSIQPATNDFLRLISFHPHMPLAPKTLCQGTSLDLQKISFSNPAIFFFDEAKVFVFIDKKMVAASTRMMLWLFANPLSALPAFRTAHWLVMHEERR